MTKWTTLARLHNEDVFVVSDLHLSNGRTLENFCSDELFNNFVTDHLSIRAESRKRTLVIAGDFIDFPRMIEERTTSPRKQGSTQIESIGRARDAIAAHPMVFAALNRHLGDGHQLVLLAGNHDVDLFWPGVRDTLAEALGDPSAHLLTFPDTWSICDRGIAIEHGHQYSYDNRFSQFPPFFDPTHLERPWGTYFMEAVYNSIESFAPWVHMVHPASKAFQLAVRHRGWDKIPPPLLPATLAFFTAHGKRMMLEQLLGTTVTTVDNNDLSAAETVLGDLSWVSDEVRWAARQILHNGVADPRLGRTDERGQSNTANALLTLALANVHTVIFGHTHYAKRVLHQGGRKAEINTGTWIGHIPLEAGPMPSFEALAAAAANPTHRRSYAYCGPNEQLGVLETYAP